MASYSLEQAEFYELRILTIPSPTALRKFLVHWMDEGATSFLLLGELPADRMFMYDQIKQALCSIVAEWDKAGASSFSGLRFVDKDMTLCWGPLTFQFIWKSPEAFSPILTDGSGGMWKGFRSGQYHAVWSGIGDAVFARNRYGHHIYETLLQTVVATASEKQAELKENLLEQHVRRISGGRERLY